MVCDATFHKTYETGFFGNVPQNKEKNCIYFGQLVHSLKYRFIDY